MVTTLRQLARMTAHSAWAWALLVAACLGAGCKSGSSTQEDAGRATTDAGKEGRAGIDAGTSYTPPPGGTDFPGHALLKSLPTPPPPVSVPRSSAELATAACTGADGQWRCSFKRPATKLGASTSAPIIPTSWTIPNWYIDPANSATCAGDTNSGTAATCTGGCSGSTCPSGIGPLQSFQELNVHRWGCQGNASVCPRLTGHNQTYTIEFLSSQTVSTDPVYLQFSQENGAAMVVEGVLGTAQQVCSTTLSAVTAKNRATPQLLKVSFAACAGAAANQLVVNSTHSSRAWIYSTAGGGAWNMSQPLAPYTVPVYNPTGTEVNTWAATDAVVVYNPVQINLVLYNPILSDFNQGTFANGPDFYQAVAWDPNGAFNDNAEYGAVIFVESQIQRTAAFTPQASTGIGFANTVNIGGLTYSGFNVLGNDQVTASGGVLNAPGGTNLASAYLDQDVIIGPANSKNGMGAILQGTVYIDTGTTVTTYGPWKYTGTSALWGPGNFNAAGRVTYPAGAGAAAAEFLLTGSLEINGQSLSCIVVPSVASPTLTCNTTVTAAHLDSNLGATSGCLSALGGGAFCNYGP